jgi:hypothetical protein
MISMAPTIAAPAAAGRATPNGARATGDAFAAKLQKAVAARQPAAQLNDDRVPADDTIANETNEPPADTEKTDGAPAVEPAPHSDRDASASTVSAAAASVVAPPPAVVTVAASISASSATATSASSLGWRAGRLLPIIDLGRDGDRCGVVGSRGHGVAVIGFRRGGDGIGFVCFRGDFFTVLGSRGFFAVIGSRGRGLAVSESCGGDGFAVSETCGGTGHRGSNDSHDTPEGWTSDCRERRCRSDQIGRRSGATGDDGRPRHRQCRRRQGRAGRRPGHW